MGKVLEVKNLRVSFRTNNGNVKAVRNISFDLEEGETLAIVGESGSGKSVTAKSIMGINAANTIIESGEIIYRGEDLLKYSERDYNKVRGNELTMVFQDPLSSLDPVMKIGKQMTEATLLNNKTKRKNAKTEAKALRKSLIAYMKKAGCQDTSLTEENVAAALKFAEEEKRAAKEVAAKALREAFPTFRKEDLQPAEAKAVAGKLVKLADAAINRLSPEKNSSEYTFHTTVEQEIKRYLSGEKNNPKEEKRVARETAKREQRLQRGKSAPKVVPASLVDMELVRHNLRKAVRLLAERYEWELAEGQKRDYHKLARQQLAYLEKREQEAKEKVTKQQAYERAINIMTDVGIKEPEKRFKQYPHEFSGGMRQRIVIAIAIAANPEILICDEPTTALDVTIQAQILELINEVKQKKKLSVLFITHDLGVVANMADKVAVMYAGKIVEYGTVEDIFYEPKHPYTWALLSSMPSLDTKEKLEAIPGTPPNMIYPPEGDAFADRNQYAMKIDFERQPPFFQVSDTHYAATWLLHPDAPKVEPPKSVTDRIKAMKEMEVVKG